MSVFPISGSFLIFNDDDRRIITTNVGSFPTFDNYTDLVSNFTDPEEGSVGVVENDEEIAGENFEADFYYYDMDSATWKKSNNSDFVSEEQLNNDFRDTETENEIASQQSINNLYNIIKVRDPLIDWGKAIESRQIGDDGYYLYTSNSKFMVIRLDDSGLSYSNLLNNRNDYNNNPETISYGNIVPDPNN